MLPSLGPGPWVSRFHVLALIRGPGPRPRPGPGPRPGVAYQGLAPATAGGLVPKFLVTRGLGYLDLVPGPGSRVPMSGPGAQDYFLGKDPVNLVLNSWFSWFPESRLAWPEPG